MVNTDDLLKIPYFEEQVFSYYCKGFKIGKTIKSPFRTEKTPSFGIYKTSYKWSLRYQDFKTKTRGNCIDFVMQLYSIDYRTAINKICIDLNISINNNNSYLNDINYIINNNNNDYIKPIENVIDKKIKYKKKEFNEFELLYWKSQGVNKEILNLFETNSVSLSFLMEEEKITPLYKYDYYKKLISNCRNAVDLEKLNQLKKIALCFAYKYDSSHIKLYRPYSNFKWMGNVKCNMVYDKNINKDKQNLLIVKARKECMHLYPLLEATDWTIVETTSETCFLPKEWLESNTFNNIIYWADNDKTGIEVANKIKSLYNINYVHTTNFKNITDMYEVEQDINLSYSILNQLIINNGTIT